MNNSLQRIDHIVVLMMENRSFDHMAGWLYDPDNAPPFQSVPRGQAFDGVSGRRLSNPIPIPYRTSSRKWVPVSKATSLTVPQINPGESFTQVATQISRGMKGFVEDYIRVLESEFANKPNRAVQYKDFQKIMECYTSDKVPVFSTLAHEYAICDRWFSSVPSQTWPNRSFLHAGTSKGFVDNSPYLHWLTNDGDTIFNRISQANRSDLTWNVYFDALDVVPLTYLIHLPKLRGYWKGHFHHMEAFFEAAKSGTLPSYSFIEPRYVVHPNDQHPPQSIKIGEQLIYDVYQAVRQGKNWEKTLLIITYDEHGGLYDHVLPPRATPPDPHAPSGKNGFRFDRLGVRVPTLLISPYIERGTVFRAQSRRGIWKREVSLDHTSVIKTICTRWGLEGLTERDQAAADVGDVLTLQEPRTGEPEVPNPRGGGEMRLLDGIDGVDGAEILLNDLQKTLLSAMSFLLPDRMWDLFPLDQPVLRYETLDDARSLLQELQQKYGK